MIAFLRPSAPTSLSCRAQISSQYEASPKLSIRFFIEEGLLEDISQDGPTGVAANRHLVEILRNKGSVVNYEEVGGSHEPLHWRGAWV